ncbi:MAG TPA: patatin-like phospholipase family protein [Casimicrobiaceae bacterium]|nr:patatin-like phospholipase family protein [Casimicrobiaceae bacterium]
MRVPVDTSTLPLRGAHLRRPTTDRLAYYANNGRSASIPQLAAPTRVVIAAIVVLLTMAGPRDARAADTAAPAAAGPSAIPATSTATPAPGIARRPRIGVVLSGGGARGLTHIGVLKVLDELHVPVDYITATSMGAIVGGLYASGMSASEMEQVMTSVPWPSLFSDQPPRRELSVRRKREEALYTIPLELGFQDFSFKLATGALSGQNLEMLLHSLTLREDDIGSFDNLPIPFRAVATNLVNGKELVFDSGPLYIAMRGSMSVPGIFAPLDLDGKMLGDGGLVNNLPVDIVKAMGAEVVIAVNIGTPLMTREQLSSFLGVAQQSINILTEQNVRAQLALLTPPRDVLISPDLGDLTAADFSKGERFIALGEKAARVAAEALSRYALPADEYAAYRAALQRQPAPVDTGLEFAGIRGTETTNPKVLEAQVGLEPGAKVDLPTAQIDIATLYGRGDFARIDYELIGPPTQHGIQFVVAEKPWGPDSMVFGVGFSSDTQGENTFGLRMRYKRTWLNSLGGEWINDFVVGTTNSVRSELYQPLTLSQTLFLAPYVGIGTTTENIFSQGVKVAEYRVLDERAGVDIGYAFGNWGDLRVGPVYVHQRGDPSIAPPTFPVTKLDEWGLALLARIDTQDNAFFPRHGLRATFEGFSGTQRQQDIDRRLKRAELDVHQSIPFGEEDAINLGLRLAGSNRFDPTLLTNFRLGGFLEISGLRYQELQGSYLGRARAVYLHRTGSLPVFGNTYYLGGSLEIGNVWQERSAISFGDTYKAGSLFFAADTPFGPFYIAWGHTTRGNSTWYLLLGRP